MTILTKQVYYPSELFCQTSNFLFKNKNEVALFYSTIGLWKVTAQFCIEKHRRQQLSIYDQGVQVIPLQNMYLHTSHTTKIPISLHQNFKPSPGPNSILLIHMRERGERGRKSPKYHSTIPIGFLWHCP